MIEIKSIKIAVALWTIVALTAIYSVFSNPPSIVYIVIGYMLSVATFKVVAIKNR